MVTASVPSTADPVGLVLFASVSTGAAADAAGVEADSNLYGRLINGAGGNLGRRGRKDSTTSGGQTGS